ncbi:MAG: hypothetical protein GC206_05985 [Alphaproteobacteria bacterium]|nr:hypothetical protein [Alphaproteobacteria bacterium]
MTPPRIVALARSAAPLSPLQAVAGTLWLAAGGADEDGAVKRAVDACWAAESGDDPYWDYLATRMQCDVCAERFKLENLALCPNCFRVGCYAHGRACACGHVMLG